MPARPGSYKGNRYLLNNVHRRTGCRQNPATNRVLCLANKVKNIDCATMDLWGNQIRIPGMVISAMRLGLIKDVQNFGALFSRPFRKLPGRGESFLAVGFVFDTVQINNDVAVGAPDAGFQRAGPYLYVRS